MGRITLRLTIDAPPERVFQLVADLDQAADRLRSVDRIERLTEGPVGVGTRWRETRTLMGRPSTEELTITRFDPPRSYTAECESCGCWFASTLACEPRAAGTDLSMSIQSKPLTWLARLMSPLSMLFAGSMKKQLHEDLEDIRRAAEQVSDG